MGYSDYGFGCWATCDTIQNMDKLNKLAKELRKNMTPQESKLWQLLRHKRFKNLAFRRQQPIGKYIVDFICREKWLIIEIDGGQHNEQNNIAYDIERTKYLETIGFKVLRFWNNEIDNNINDVLDEIDKYT